MKRVRHLYVAFGFTVAALLCAAFKPADAQTIGSAYTSTSPKNCRIIGKPSELDGSTTRVCPGKSGLVVLISEDDLRETVSVGRNPAAADKEPAASASFGPFNSTATTIEWRSMKGKPFAAIQRWHIADIDDEDRNGRPVAKSMLVVTRLPPGEVCHVAYVDIKANADAEGLARKAADDFARSFKCGADKVKVIGESGRAVELARGR